jgi:hypothetical protein
MRAFVKALLLGLLGLAVCTAFPAAKVVLLVTVLTAVVASWRGIKRWFR